MMVAKSLILLVLAAMAVATYAHPLASHNRAGRQTRKVNKDEGADCLDKKTDTTHRSGSRFKNDCNWCFCNNGHIGCTHMACLPAAVQLPAVESQLSLLPQVEDPSLLPEVENPSLLPALMRRQVPEGPEQLPAKFCMDDKGQIHEHGLVYNESCNTCYCHHGHPMCTEMYCDGPVHYRVRKTMKSEDRPKMLTAYLCVDEMGIMYRDGYSYMYECNQCHCVGGMPLCTLMTCSGGLMRRQAKPAPVLLPAVSSCQDGDGNMYKDGDSYMNDCNKCYCAGDMPLCTMMVCTGDMKRRQAPMPEHSPGLLPAPGAPVLLPTNVCFDDNGKTVAYGASYKKECNWCYCADGIPTCTRKACHDSLVLTKRQPMQDPVQLPALERPVQLPALSGCVDDKGNRYSNGEWYMNACNRCYCIKGQPRCTKKWCY